MAYILIINARILNLAGAPDDDPKTHMPFKCVLAATAISAAVGSILVGLMGNLPFGLAPGMGVNSYFTYGICLRLGLSWQVALTTSFVMGALFLVLALLGVCNLIQHFAPASIKKSVTVGLGIFQALIGFDMMGLVVRGEHTLLEIGNVLDPKVMLAFGSLLLIAMLMVLNVPGAMLIGMAAVTAISWMTGLEPAPQKIFATPEIEATLFKLDFPGFFANIGSTLPITLILLFVAVFDTAGVQFSAGTQADLMDKDGKLPGSKVGGCVRSFVWFSGVRWVRCCCCGVLWQGLVLRCPLLLCPVRSCPVLALAYPLVSAIFPLASSRILPSCVSACLFWLGLAV